tara:strand:+ start:3708 stop:4190 length:483 start_codon:yes stop_codon:yes gene_type:complete
MAFQKQPYNWQRIKAGDIISFTYESKRSKKKKINCILVLNPRLPIQRKDGSNSLQLIGIKLKENQKPVIRMTTPIVRILERIGKFVPVNYEEDLFRIDFKKTYIISEIKGIKNTGFEKINTNRQIKNNYRTYNYYRARKSPVFLEPVIVTEKENYKQDED